MKRTRIYENDVNPDIYHSMWIFYQAAHECPCQISSAGISLTISTKELIGLWGKSLDKKFMKFYSLLSQQWFILKIV
jgi:hypothetical protein